MENALAMLCCHKLSKQQIRPAFKLITNDSLKFAVLKNKWTKQYKKCVFSFAFMYTSSPKACLRQGWSLFL